MGRKVATTLLSIKALEQFIKKSNKAPEDLKILVVGQTHKQIARGVVEFLITSKTFPEVCENCDPPNIVF